jgi:hypothetical protein
VRPFFLLREVIHGPRAGQARFCVVYVDQKYRLATDYRCAAPAWPTIRPQPLSAKSATHTARWPRASLVLGVAARPHLPINETHHRTRVSRPTNRGGPVCSGIRQNKRASPGSERMPLVHILSHRRMCRRERTDHR